VGLNGKPGSSGHPSDDVKYRSTVALINPNTFLAIDNKNRKHSDPQNQTLFRQGAPQKKLSMPISE
jgi:hypothetical protein